MFASHHQIYTKPCTARPSEFSDSYYKCWSQSLTDSKKQKTKQTNKNKNKKNSMRIYKNRFGSLICTLILIFFVCLFFKPNTTSDE